MAYFPVSAIEVKCWGHKVGVLAPHPQRSFYVFEYYPEFRNSGIELAPLTVPLSQSGSQYYPHLSAETFHRLPAFIADSLPDSFGNHLIDAWMARQGVAKNEITVLDRLAYMGSRGMGALEFEPAIARAAEKSSALEMKDLVEAARRSLEMDAREFDAETDKAIAQLIQVGTSAGGAKAKAVVGYNQKTGSLVSGQFKLPQGYEAWLIKINTSENEVMDYGRIEYAYYLMATACGISMAESQLFEAAGRMHFMTKRFDRKAGNEKLHMQTLCAMNELDYNQLATHDYVQFFSTIESLELGYAALDEGFDRMVFNVCAANNDDHTKNQSFLLEEGSSWQLAPAYDLMHASIPGNAWIEQHLMGVGGKFHGINRQDLRNMGRRFGVSDLEERISRVAETVADWPHYAKQAGLSSSETERVYKDITQRLALIKGK